MNPTALRKLMLHSKNKLSFNDACQFILSLLQTVYRTLQKKAELLNNTDKENSIPVKKPKLNDDSDSKNKFPY